MIHWLGNTYEQVEAIAGAAAAFFIGFFPPVFLFFGVFMALGQHWAFGLLAFLGFLAATAMAAWVTRLVGTALYDRYPRFRPASLKPIDAALVAEILPDDGDDPDERTTAGFGSREEALAAMNDRVRWLSETPEEAANESVSGETRPVALLVAGRLRGVTPLLRPVFSLWWIAHFIGGAFVGLAVSRFAIDLIQNPANAWLIVLPLAFQIAFLFAVNLYLVMAVGVLFRNAWLCEIVWKWRFVLDLVVCVWTLFLVR